MDFRPDRNTLIANYLLIFGAVGGIFLASVGKPTRYYYSPPHNSHAGYGSGTESCSQCHIRPWARFEEKTCYTSACHGRFSPHSGQLTRAELALESDERGNPKPHYGALIAFHRHMNGDISCESCHPSHRLPQHGLFNKATLQLAVAERVKKGAAPGYAEQQALKTELFHVRAEEFTGKISCRSCHVEALDAEEGNRGVGAVPDPATGRWTMAEHPGGLARMQEEAGR